MPAAHPEGRPASPLVRRARRPYSPLMPDRVVLRYFDCLGRAQPIRNALVDAGVAFEDQRITIGQSWRALKEQAEGGPFGSLPVLEWGDDCVAQAMPIAGYVARRLGHRERAERPAFRLLFERTPRLADSDSLVLERDPCVDERVANGLRAAEAVEVPEDYAVRHERGIGTPGATDGGWRGGPRGVPRASLR